MRALSIKLIIDERNVWLFSISTVGKSKLN